MNHHFLHALISLLISSPASSFEEADKSQEHGSQDEPRGLFSKDFRLIVREHGKEFAYKFKKNDSSKLECQFLSLEVEQEKLIDCDNVGELKPLKEDYFIAKKSKKIDLTNDVLESSITQPRETILVSSIIIRTSDKSSPHIDIFLLKSPGKERIERIKSFDQFKLLKKALEPLSFSWLHKRAASKGYIRAILIKDSNSHSKKNQIKIKIKKRGSKTITKNLKLKHQNYAALTDLLRSNKFVYIIPYASSSSCRLRIGVFFDRTFLQKIMQRFGIKNVLSRSSFIATEVLLLVQEQLSKLFTCRIIVTFFKFLPIEIIPNTHARAYLRNFAIREVKLSQSKNMDLGILFTWTSYEDVNPAVSNPGSICSTHPSDAFLLVSFKIRRTKYGNSYDRMATLVTHEIGHALGIKHDQCTKKSIMSDKIGLAQRKWSKCAKKGLDIHKLNCLYS